MKDSPEAVQTEIQDRAILVSLAWDSEPDDLVHYALEELRRLAETAGVEVLDSVLQRRERPDVKYLIGKGKVEEVRLKLRALEGNTVIFNQELTGSQVRNLEEALDAKIIDRTQLILDIFAQRAKTREGMLQVELAQLSYLLPRLSGHGINLSRLGGGIGTRGPGETKLETDRRHIRRRISELRRQLAEVKRHRSLQRERRKKSGVFQAALVGYTNAGKSTLLNQLTRSDVFAENQLFATLDPTSRQLSLNGAGEVVLTDTVGFIQDLPHELVAAFRATLEEVLEADLILHVVDASSPMRENQIRVVEKVLDELGAAGKETLMIYNKIDLCTPAELEMIPDRPKVLKVSAWNEADLETIRETLQQRLLTEPVHLRLPAERGDLAALAYRIGEVLERQTEEDTILMRVRMLQSELKQAAPELEPYILKE